MRTSGLLAARALLLAVAMLSAAYGLLAHIPFTYQAVLQAGLLTWLPAALAWQPWAFAAAILINAAADRAEGSLSRVRLVWYGFAGAGALAQLMWPILPRLQGGPAAGAWIVAFLLAALVPLGLDLLDRVPTLPPYRTEADPARRLLLAAVLASLAWPLLSFALALARTPTVPPVLEALAILGWSLVAHGLLFLMGAVAVFGLQAAARFFPRPLAADLGLTLGSGALLVAALIQTVVFPGIAFTGPFAFALAVLLGLCLVAFLGVCGLRLHPSDQPVEGALDLLLRPLSPLSPGSLRAAAAWALALVGLAAVAGPKLSHFDWNFLFQQLGAALLATLVFAACHRGIRSAPAHRSWSGRLFGATLLALALFKAWATPAPPVARSAPYRPQVRTLEAHAGFDASVRLAAALLRPVAAGEASIYRFLLANSNIPASVPVAPLDLALPPTAPPGFGPQSRPDIYLLVVDSLRQDYLGAYNPAVTFTPAMDRFAAEATVFQNAYTRYGATGLSEPSIWVGGMLVHKQYVTPFHPMNRLQKLVREEGYTPHLSMDSILNVVLEPAPGLVQLDKGRDTSDLRMGPTLQELKAHLDRHPAGRPVFFYGQCQDIHISSIQREGKGVPGGGEYPGFYAPYAARVRRLDQAFGDFIQHLKDTGRYDRSIVILTADHGDSLGEGGRFGHAYTIHPEILRVPLIIHLPEALRRRMVVDAARTAFLTDITPSLCYLLGRRPLAPDPVLGRPLFTETEAEQTWSRRPHHLVASSYGAVYGILADDGSALYIADAVNLTDHYFDLRRDPKGTRNALTPELKRRYDQLILDEIKHLNAFYHFRSGS